MAVSSGFGLDEGKLYNGRITLFLVLSCMTAAVGGLIFGYDSGISGGVTSMEPFLKKFFPNVYAQMQEETKTSNYCKFDSQLLTLFTSSLYIAGLVTSLFASHVTESYGRKPSIFIGGAAFFIGAALGAAAFNVYMLILGRMLLGVGVGFANQAIPLYLSEMALPKYRGAINSGVQLSTNFGILAAALVNYKAEKIEAGFGWRISLGLAMVPALILTAGVLFLPETPNSLIQRTRNQMKAKKMLQMIRGTDDVQAELNDLIKASYISKTIKNPYRNIMRRKYLPQLVMSIAIPTFQQATGVNVIGFYAPQLFRTVGLGESNSLLSSVVLGVMGLGTVFITMSFVDKFGRRFLLILGGIVMFITQMAIGGLMGAKLGDQGALSKEYAFVILILICIYAVAFTLSWGPLGWLIPSEISPLEIRSAGQSIAVSINFFFSFIVGQTFLSMLCFFKYGTFFFFGGWVAVMTIFVCLFLPETKNIPIEQMAGIWKNHWFWKRFVEHDDTTDTSYVLLE